MTSQCTYGPVDILMATYNGEKYIGEQISSIRSQTYGDWKLLVSDDGSSDGTTRIVDEAIRDDSRISWAPDCGKHRGSYGNFMYLLNLSKSGYSMFCDQDDVWLPNKIEVIFNKMEELETKYPDSPIMVFTDLEVVDESLNTISKSFDEMMGIDPSRVSLKELLFAGVAPGCTIMLNKKLRDIVVGCENTGGVKVHDWWISLVAACVGHIGYVPAATSKYRQHSSNQFGAIQTSLSKTLLTTSVRSARENILDTIKRANECYRSLGPLMSDENRQSLRAFLSIPNAPWYKRVVLLADAGIWKHGLLRKVGQAFITMTMKFPREYQRMCSM